MRYYVGYRLMGGREVFRADSEPTEESHGHLYGAAWGPFRTRRAAEFGASEHAVNNPHVVTVSDAERVAAEYCDNGTANG